MSVYSVHLVNQVSKKTLKRPLLGKVCSFSIGEVSE